MCIRDRPATAAGHRAAPPAPGRSPGRHRWRTPGRSRRVDDRWVILVRTRAWVPSRDLSGDREEPTPAVIYTGEETRPSRAGRRSNEAPPFRLPGRTHRQPRSPAAGDLVGARRPRQRAVREVAAPPAGNAVLVAGRVAKP